MSDLLLINQLPFAVKDGTARKASPEEIGGSRVRSYGGSLMSSRRALKRSYSVGSSLMLESEARAWQGLLLGEGHYWSFNSSLYSSKGLGPDAGYNASFSASGGKFGAGRLIVPDSTGTISFDTRLGNNWTVMLYRKESGVWVHYVVNSDGDNWRNGVLNGGIVDPADFLDVSGGGAVTLFELDVSDRDFDDLVAVPYVFLPAWSALRSAATQAWGATPSLSATGELIHGGSATVRAELGETEIVQALMSGAWEQNLQRFPVTLTEV